MLRTFLFAIAFALAGLLGRLTVVDGGALALVWPAAGVAIVWFLVKDARPVSVDTAVLAATSFTVNALTGASVQLAAALILSNVVQVVVAVTILRRASPHLWGCGGDAPIARTRDLGWFALACVLGTSAGTVLSVAGLSLVSWHLTFEAAEVLWGRNLCGAVLVGAIGLLTGQRIAVGPSPTVTSWRFRIGEAVALVAATVALYIAAFALSTLPLAFPLLISSVWVGLRFSTLFVAWHAFAGAAAGTVFTLQGLGPFAAVVDLQLAALLAQLFMVMVAGTGLTIAVVRDERAALAGELAAAEAEATTQARLMQTIVDAMGEGLMVLDGDDQVVVQNPAAVRLLGFDSRTDPDAARDVMVGSDGQPISEDERPSIRALRGEHIGRSDVTVRHPDGTQLDLRVSATHLPPVGPDGLSRAVLAFHDVTADREQREDLKAFAGVVAHDILNPLTGLRGWALQLRDELEEGGLDPALAITMVDRILSSSDRMRALVADLLANATAEDRVLDMQPVDLTAIVADITASHDLGHAVEHGDLGHATGDRVLLRQLFDNLIGNSVKYVARGVAPRIELSTRLAMDRVEVCLADNGIGIPVAERERVFDRFHRAHANDYPGSGLGLHICRRTVERHGGVISVRDNPTGQGTVFEFTLPSLS